MRCRKTSWLYILYYILLHFLLYSATLAFCLWYNAVSVYVSSLRNAWNLCVHVPCCALNLEKILWSCLDIERVLGCLVLSGFSCLADFAIKFRLCCFVQCLLQCAIQFVLNQKLLRVCLLLITWLTSLAWGTLQLRWHIKQLLMVHSMDAGTPFCIGSRICIWEPSFQSKSWSMHIGASRSKCMWLGLYLSWKGFWSVK